MITGINQFHREEIDPTIHTVRLGLTYKFDVHNRARCRSSSDPAVSGLRNHSGATGDGGSSFLPAAQLRLSG